MRTFHMEKIHTTNNYRAIIPILADKYTFAVKGFAGLYRWIPSTYGHVQPTLRKLKQRLDVPFCDRFGCSFPPHNQEKKQENLSINVTQDAQKQNIPQNNINQETDIFHQEICWNLDLKKSLSWSLGQKVMPFFSCCPRHGFTPRCQAMASTGRSCWTWTSRRSLREGKLIVSLFFAAGNDVIRR